jgi:hypothetical protein
MTGTGMVVGTPDYLSPEQALAEPLDGRSDQYALGLILREMLTGRLPFAGGTAAEMMTQRVVNEAPSLQAERPDLPPWVIALTDRLLRRRAAQRFDDTGEIAQVIAQARLIPTISDHAPRRVRIGAALLVLSLVAAAGWWAWRAGESPSPVPAVAAIATLDVAVLPFVADAPGQQALATRIGTELVDGLQAQSRPGVADGERVARALRVLGFDAGNVGDHLDRVADELHAERLIQGRLERVADGLRLHVVARKDGVATPEWTLTSSDFAPDAADATVGPLLGASACASGRDFGCGSRGDGRGRSLARTGGAGGGSAFARRTQSGACLARRSGAGDAVGLAAPARLRQLAGRRCRRRRVAAGAAGAVATKRSSRAAGAGARACRTRRVRPGRSRPAGLARGKTSAMSRAWFLRGKFAIMQGDAKTAVDDYLVRALVLAKRLDDRRWRAEIANAFGVGYRNLGRMAEAAEEYETAIRARHALGDARGEAVSRRNLAVALGLSGSP